MKTKYKTPSVVPIATPAAIIASGFTLGLDLGDRQHHVRVLNASDMTPIQSSEPTVVGAVSA